MATFHDRTTAPRVQRGLLRAAGAPCTVLTSADVVTLTADAPDLPIPFIFRPSPPVDDPRTAVELLDEIRRTIEAQEVSGQLAQKCRPEGEAIRSLKSEEPKSATIADLLPPAPLPSLTTAFSRRRTIFGALAATGLLAGSSARARGGSDAPEVPADDAGLVALAADLDATLDGAAYAMAPIHDEADQNRRPDNAEDTLRRMSKIPAQSGRGLNAKAQAWLDSDSYDVQEGNRLAESLSQDIERLFAAGGLR